LVQVFVLAALIGHPASLILRVFVYVFVVAALAPVLAVSVLLAAALPFGWDGPFLSIFASCSAEATATRCAGGDHHRRACATAILPERHPAFMANDTRSQVSARPPAWSNW
jgi:hypothetical protein